MGLNVHLFLCGRIGLWFRGDFKITTILLAIFVGLLFGRKILVKINYITNRVRVNSGICAHLLRDNRT